MRYLALIAFCLFFAACGNNPANEDLENGKPIAKAGNEVLDEGDFKHIFISGGKPADSAANAKKTIENWAVESLFYQEAISKLEKEEMQIDKQVEAYRRELVNYIYSTRIIDANLDTNISLAEIEAYYNAHLDNFILKENIVKVNYLKVPVKAPGLDKIKRLLMMGMAKPDDAEQLKKLCVQNADNFFLNDSTWLYMEEIKKEIPMLRDQPEFNMVPGRILQFNDEEYYYYLKIKDVKIRNGVSPLNFERPNIKKFIINNRKTQLLAQYKQLLLEKARSGKTFETY